MGKIQACDGFPGHSTGAPAFAKATPPQYNKDQYFSASRICLLPLWSVNVTLKRVEEERIFLNSLLGLPLPSLAHCCDGTTLNRGHSVRGQPFFLGWMIFLCFRHNARTEMYPVCGFDIHTLQVSLPLLLMFNRSKNHRRQRGFFGFCGWGPFSFLPRICTLGSMLLLTRLTRYLSSVGFSKITWIDCAGRCTQSPCRYNLYLSDNSYMFGFFSELLSHPFRWPPKSWKITSWYERFRYLYY